jgi:Domain of unknown function (DUF4397)
MTSSRRNASLAGLAALLAFAGCGYNDKVTAVGPTPLSRVMVVQASPDAPRLDTWLDGSLAGPSMNYLTNSAYLTTAQSNAHVQLIVPADPNNPAYTVMDTSVPVPASGACTVLAADSVSRMAPVVLQDDLSDPPSGMARIRFVHCLVSSGPVDFAVTGGAILASNVPFKSGGPWLLVGAGTYDLEARPTGDATTQLATAQGLVFTAGHVYTLWLYPPVVKNAPSVPGFQAIVNR